MPLHSLYENPRPGNEARCYTVICVVLDQLSSEDGIARSILRSQNYAEQINRDNRGQRL